MTPTPSAGYTVHYYLFSCELVLNLALELSWMWKRHLLKLECTHLPLNLPILSSTNLPFTLTTVQVLNLALTDTKRIQCKYRKRKWNFTLSISELELYFSHPSDNIFKFYFYCCWLLQDPPPPFLTCSIIPKGLKVQALNIFSKDGRDMTQCVGYSTRVETNNPFAKFSFSQNYLIFVCIMERPEQGDVIRDRAVDWLKFIPYEHYI